MATVLISAPYMLPFIERFRPVFEHYNLDLIIPEVHERLSEEELLAYAGQFDGTLCGDDRYTRRVLAACTPRLKVISNINCNLSSPLEIDIVVNHGFQKFQKIFPIIVYVVIHEACFL